MDQSNAFYHELKQLRIAQGISLDDISAHTRINSRFLEALEQGEYDILPNTYMRLFLRSYCREVGADEKAVLKQLEEYQGESEDGRAAILSTKVLSPPPQAEKILNLANRGPARIRRDFLAGAGIFIALVVITFFAQRVYQKPASDDVTPTTTSNSPVIPANETAAQPLLEGYRSNAETSRPPATNRRSADLQPPGRRSQPVVPEESALELPDELFAEERIVFHHMERLRLTSPVRLTLMARDNVVIQPLSNGQRGPAFNLTVAEARIWTLQGDLILRTPAIELLRGDLNGIPIDLGQASGIGALRVSPRGEYEVFAYADTTL